MDGRLFISGRYRIFITELIYALLFIISAFLFNPMIAKANTLYNGDFINDETVDRSKFTGTSAEWSIDDNGKLVVTGSITHSGVGETDWPWTNYASSIISADLSTASAGGSLAFMFFSCKNLKDINLAGFNTSGVTDMHGMFSNCSGLSNLNLSNINSSQVTDMSRMFAECISLTSIDLSGFDTSKVTDMGKMFSNCENLSKITLGSTFSFQGASITSVSNQAVLPTPQSTTTTGKWMLENDASGTSALTPEQMRNKGTVDAGTWVWQISPTYTVSWNANGGSGNMEESQFTASEDAAIPADTFYLFNKHVVSWNENADGTGTSYKVDGFIPADTYSAGEAITLYAIWEDNTNVEKISDGVYEVEIPGNSSIDLGNLPAGTSYRVYEETDDGWVVVTQKNASGIIGTLQESQASFINRYNPSSTSVTLMATKTVNGSPAKASQGFTFQLLDKENNILQSKTVSDGGIVIFDPIEYEETGTWTYSIREVNTGDETVTYDTHIEPVIVSVTENDGTLSSSVAYDKDGASFENSYNPGSLTITKNIENATSASQDDTFTFYVRLTNANGEAVAPEGYSITSANGGEAEK